MTANASFTRPDGTTCPAYYNEPAAGPSAPGVVVIQEWWGVNAQIVGVAGRLVQAGYRVLVPDLYRGELALDAAEAEHKMSALDFGDAARQDVSGAVRHLKQSSPKVGVIGFCMGGALSVLAAMHAPDLDAAITWYGLPPDEAGDFGRIAVPLQGHFGLQDPMVKPQRVDEVEQRLKAGGADYQFFRYDANHAFGNETWNNYDAAATHQAWARTMDFFARQL